VVNGVSAVGEPSAPPRLPPFERWVIAVWAGALPAHFRDRQRDEWTADLMVLSASHGRPARWRYLLGAGWTLPSLRRLARGAQTAGAGLTPPAAPSGLTAARVLILGLSWPLLGWLGTFVVPHPAKAAALLRLGAWANLIGVFALALVAVAALAVAVFEWRRPPRYRLRTAGIGFAALLTVFVFQCLAVLPDRGVLVALMGTAGARLSFTAAGLPKRYRIALRVVAVMGLAIAIANWTPWGAGRGTDFLD